MADLRGGMPQWMAGLPAAQAPAAAAVPSLLQMAQGIAPDAGARGGGFGDEGFRDDSALVAQNYQKALASQGTAAPDAFRDDTGLVAHNMQVGRASQAAGGGGGGGGGDGRGGAGGPTEAPWPAVGAPPAFQEKGNEQIWPSLFSGGPPTGWFTLDDYYKGQPGGQGRTPDIFQSGAGLPSTNDWRLLPPQYRDPNYFQINGQIIDRRAAGRELSPASNWVMGLESGWNGTPNVGSQGRGGFPRTFFSGDAYAAGAFPGQLGPRSQWWSGE